MPYALPRDDNTDGNILWLDILIYQMEDVFLKPATRQIFQFLVRQHALRLRHEFDVVE